MPGIEFKLTSSYVSFSADEESDKWSLTFNGKCAHPERRKTFTIQDNNNSWSGFDADVLVFIKLRRPRAEAAGIPPNTPWVSNDDLRDAIHVTCPSEHGDTPIFQISIWLPEDAYQRLTNVDWTKQTVGLWVSTPLFGPGDLPIIMGDDPDGRDLIWRSEIRPYEFLEDFTLSLTPIASQKICLADFPVEKRTDDEKPANPVAQILDSVERATVSIGELRATIVKVAWALVAVMVVTAFIR